MAPAPNHVPIEVVSVRVRESTSIGRERLLELCFGLWKRDRGVQINRQNIQESEQMITTEGQIMSSCNGRMIRLFNSTMLQGDCHFVEAFFNLERRRINHDQSQRSNEEEKRETETDSKN